MRTLEHVNAATAQTWNYMKINQIALEVPDAELLAGSAKVVAECADGAVKVQAVGEVPAEFAGIETGIGEEAAAWIDDAAAAAKAVVEVAEGVQLSEPIVVDLAKAGAAAASTCVAVRKGARASVVVIADAAEDGAAAEGSAAAGDLTASLVRLVVEEDAHADVFEMTALPDSKSHLEGFGIECADGASVNVRQYSLSAGTSAIGLAANLAGAESSIDVQLHYLGRDSQTIDINHLVRMRGRDTRSRIDESGVLADAAHKTLRATIDLVRGGKGAKGREQETVVVTGDAVVNKTLPVILCDEEDVQGDHGATIGSMSAEQLEYMRDRGLSTSQAEELFERAVVDEAVIHAPTKRAHEVALYAAEMLFGHDAVDEIADAVQHDWN